MDKFKICAKILEGKDGTVNAKQEVLSFLLGLTETEEGLNTLYKLVDAIVVPVIDTTYHSDQDVAKNAMKVLVNISAESKGAQILCADRSIAEAGDVNGSKYIFSALLDHVLAENSSVTEYAIMTTVNLSRNERMARKIYESLENEEIIKTISSLAVKTNSKYDYLSSLLANLTQLPEVRGILLRQSNRGVLCKLLALIGYEDEVIRRNGAVSVIRNLCLSVENHESLLDPKINLVARILLPLAGPEEFDDEDNDKLPLDLQYLPPDKTREPTASIRKMLLEIIMQLCATTSAREVLRKCNVYVILREYHKWEKNHECLETCEDVVNILIRTEEEIGIDNLGNVNIPSDLVEKFNKLDHTE